MDGSQRLEIPTALVWRMVAFADEVANVNSGSLALRLQAEDLARALRELSELEAGTCEQGR